MPDPKKDDIIELTDIIEYGAGAFKIDPAVIEELRHDLEKYIDEKIQKAVPAAAAGIIREEIQALLKEVG